MEPLLYTYLKYYALKKNRKEKKQETYRQETKFFFRFVVTKKQNLTYHAGNTEVLYKFGITDNRMCYTKIRGKKVKPPYRTLSVFYA